MNFPSIGSLFGAAPTQPVPTPGNIPANTAVTSASTNTVATAPNGAIPATAEVNKEGTKTGLDAFVDLWKTDPNPAAPGQPLFNVSQEDLLKAARTQSFKPEVTQEQMAAINAGGPEAFKVMLDVMNDMSQKVYAQGAFATTKLINGGLDKANFAKSSDIDTAIKRSTVSNSLREDNNPLFSHAATQPLIASIEAQMLVKHPTATASEITAMARAYITEFADMVKAPEVAATAEKANKVKSSENWDKFFVTQ